MQDFLRGMVANRIEHTNNRRCDSVGSHIIFRFRPPSPPAGGFGETPLCIYVIQTFLPWQCLYLTERPSSLTAPHGQGSLRPASSLPIEF